jgi:hypothetical protein
MAENQRLRADVKRLKSAIADTSTAKSAENEQLVEALIWCSASEDFQEGGQAREGWLKLCKPLIDAHVALAAEDES